MAKALFLLKAHENRDQALLESAKDFTKTLFKDLDPTKYTLRVLSSLQDDPLLNRKRPDHPADVTIEIKARPGLPLSTVLDSWKDPGHRVLDGLNSEKSMALVMHERCWRNLPPQPFCYHYLMVRRKGFSSADYCDYYLNSHSRFGLATPGIDRYSQNLVDPESSVMLCEKAGLAYIEVDSISELQMSDINTFMSAVAATTVGLDAAQDEARFVDRDSSVMYCSSVSLDLGVHKNIDIGIFS